METDRRLAGARAALDDERAVGLGGDEAVLVGLDRRDDVAHPRVAAAVELLEEEVGDSGALDRAAVERLVGDVEELASLRAEAAALRDAVRILRRRGVERPRGRRLPVDDERLLLGVRDPAAADIQRPRIRIEAQPAEDETALGVLERLHAALRPRLHVERRPLGRHRLLRALDGRTHPVELVVRGVDVVLLGG